MRQCSKSQANPDVGSRHNCTWPEEEPDERTCFRILPCPAEIEEPDDRQVLDVMPGFEHQQTHFRSLRDRNRIGQIKRRYGNEYKLQWIGFPALSQTVENQEDVINGQYDRRSQPAACEPEESRT